MFRGVFQSRVVACRGSMICVGLRFTKLSGFPPRSGSKQSIAGAGWSMSCDDRSEVNKENNLIGNHSSSINSSKYSYEHLPQPIQIHPEYIFFRRFARPGGPLRHFAYTLSSLARPCRILQIQLQSSVSADILQALSPSLAPSLAWKYGLILHDSAARTVNVVHMILRHPGVHRPGCFKLVPASRAATVKAP